MKGRIDCTSLVLRDEEGNPRAELFVSDKGSVTFRLSDGFGHPRVLIGIGSGGEAFVERLHARGRVGVELHVSEAGQPTLQVRAYDDARTGFVVTVPPDDETRPGFINRAGSIWPVFRSGPPAEPDLNAV